MNETYFENELKNCTFVKFVLMVLVVVYHSILFWGGRWFAVLPLEQTSSFFSTLIYYLNSFHIYAFTLVSGYIFSFLYYEKGRYSDCVSFVETKFKRLIVPCVFISIIWVIPISNIFFNYSSTEIIFNYVLAVSPSQLWFLWMLFWVFIIAWLFADRLKNDIFAFAFSLVMLVFGNACLLMGFLNVFFLLMSLTYIPFFVLGMKLREKRTWFVRKIPLYVYVIVQIVLFNVWFYSLKVIIFHPIIDTIASFILHFWSTLTCFFLLQTLARKVRWENSKIISKLSSKSMTIYMLHQQIIYVCIYFLNGKVNPYMNALINVVVSLALSYLIAALLSRFKVTRVLIGEK